MTTQNLFFILALAFGVCFITFSMMIVHQLSKRNVKINYLLLRFLIPKYAFQYKKMSQRENGKVGSLFYGWIISINLALLCVILGFIL